ncbi:uroporphyrinogen-III synthase [Roseibium album]|uniref:uroporphyrinogen-III synthase n=1 Tax=Roseibium album TaxID=311410 RepID=UPI003918C419
MRFLVTRPQPDCKQTADKIRAAGHHADEAPLLDFRAEPPAQFDLDGVAALAFSSRRALSTLERHAQLRDLQDLPVFAVGDATADACRRAGYRDVVSASGDVEALGHLILGSRDRLGPGDVLYPAAKERAGNLEGILAEGGLCCRVSVVYSMQEVTAFPQSFNETLRSGGYDGVLVYSRRTADVLLRLLRNQEPDHSFSSLRIYTISHRAAEPLSVYMRVEVADAACEKALLDLALAEC